ncbi:MAG: copper chaperone PCu(A)C [Rhizomicrobium sp.]
MKKVLLNVVGLAVLFLGVPAGAAQVTVSNAWFRSLPAHLPAGGYLTLNNSGPDVQLTGARSPACGMLMLHKSTTSGGMAEMAMVPSVNIPHGGTVAFAPGGYHLMCTSPTAAMVPGGKVSVTLAFSDGSTSTVVFAVKNATGK